MSHKTLIVSSANVTGNDKSQVKYRFSPPLVIPKDAVNPYVEVLSSQIWWNNPNIDSTNNTLNFTLGGVARQWVADTGLYSVDDINSALGYYVKSIGHPSDTIKFVGRGFDGKLMCEMDGGSITHGITIHWSTSSMATFLGFGTNSDFYVAYNTEGTQVANNKAIFNSLLYWAIECVGLGTGSNVYDEQGKPTSIIHTAVPDVETGRQNTFQPAHPVRVPIQATGQQIPELVFNLTDQNHQRVDTLGEDWNCIVQISWD